MINRGLALLSLLAIFASLTVAQSAIPASRQGDRVAVITIEGPIDAMTARSVNRRIAQAENGGFDAMVFELNTPGGGLGAVLDITASIKGSSITNTIAWVNHDAYSGGAIIALACREIVSSSPAAMGDAFIIVPPTFQDAYKTGRTTLRALTPDERTKALPVLLADVTDSARRHGYDEYLVQAIVVDGIELWLVEDPDTGARYAINFNEYLLLFDEDPLRGKPMLAGATGGVSTAPESVERPEPNSDGSSSDGFTPPDYDPSKDFQPASDTLGDIEQEFSNPERIGELAFDVATNRPEFSASDTGKYRMVAYVSDGTAAIVMREGQMQELGFSSGVINTDEELMTFMGAKEMIRQGESWSESLVRLLTNPFARGLFIVVFLVAMFIEMIAPGFGFGGTVALIALGLLIAPAAILGFAGWWEVVAIGAGIILLMLEAFVLPGFGVFGVLGLISLFGGLLGTFIPAGGSFAAPSTQQDLLTGATTMLLSLVTAGVVMWLILKNMKSIPILDRLMLSGATGVSADPSGHSLLSVIAPHADDIARVGDRGMTTTPLRPSGQADIEGELMTVYAGIGYIEPGTAVRVTSVQPMRIEVEPDNQGSKVDDAREEQG